MKGHVSKMRLKKDIVIPAGTVFSGIPRNSGTKYLEDNYESTIGLTKNSFGTLVYCVDRDDAELLKEWFVDVEVAKSSDFGTGFKDE